MLGIVGIGPAQDRFLGPTDFSGIRASRPEYTPGGPVDGTRDVAFEKNPLLAVPGMRVGKRHGRKQRVGIRVMMGEIDFPAAGQLDQLAEIHDGDPVTDVPHQPKVMGDEQVGEVVRTGAPPSG